MRYLMYWLKTKGRLMMEQGRSLQHEEKGAIDIGGILLMAIGMVFLAVGFIMFPIVTTATDALLGYVCAACASITDATFTGFTAVIGITPLLVLIGYLSAAVFSMFLGVKIMKGGGAGTKLDLGTLILLALSLVFIAIALIVLPVALDGICSILGPGINAAYTGLSPILLVTPLLILISFLAGAVITGFFGLKRISGSSD